VCDLISPITGYWDVELLQTIFCNVDVGRILEIPLHNQGFDDFIAWNFNKNGRYSVRSGYHLQWRHQFGARGAHLALPGSSALNPVWKELWQMKVPSKIKIFLWRALHGIVPLKSILANKHIGTSGQCPVCMAAPEDVLHLLFQCTAAREVWTDLGIQSIIDEAISVDQSGSAVLEFLLRDQGKVCRGFSLLI
jgi:hypothetical protein